MKGLSMFMSYDEYDSAVGLQRIEDNEMTRVSFDRSKQVMEADDAFEVLCQALCTNTSVTHLRISYNTALTDKPIQALVEMLRFNTSIESLTILLRPEDNVLNVEQMSVLASGLQGNSTLQEFALENCFLGNNVPVLEVLIRGIGPNITSLGLSSNRIDDAKTIATFLQTNSTLKILELWDNQIGEQGALQLWQALALNSTLEVLSVKKNGISDELERKLMLQVESNRSENPSKTKKKKKQTTAGVALRKKAGNSDDSTAMEARVATLEQSHMEQAKVIADLHQKLEAQGELFQKLGKMFSPSGAATTKSSTTARKKRKVKA
jgi:hypothetical protein